MKPWQKAVSDARKTLGFTGFVPVGGKTPEGQALYEEAVTLYNAEKNS